MSIEITKYQSKVYIAKKFKDTFVNSEHQDVGLVFIGNPLPYANSDTVIPDIDDTIVDDKVIWSTMLVSKKITPSDVELVIGRNDWTSGRVYKQFDDIIHVDSLILSDSGNNVYAMYTMNSEGNVYKCISNNNGSDSTYEPTGNYTISDGFIETSDGYIWKYMYNIKTSNKFLTNTWMPVPFIGDNYSVTLDYNINQAYNKNGTLSLIIVENKGNNYTHTTTNVESFSTGSSSLVLPSLANVKVNMSVSGYGILPETHIVSIIPEYNSIHLSQNTIYDGGGEFLANTITISTRVNVVGDGQDVLASVILANTSIDKIDVSSIGINYNKANVFIYGTATNNVAIARAVISPKYGHGYNPAIELNATNIMVIKKFGDVDSTESGAISNDIAFRQYGILLNPYKYNLEERLGYYSSNTTISQTLDVTLESGNLYNLNDYVYQGSPGAPSFSGYVVSQSSLVVKITKYEGTMDIGALLTNGTVSRPVKSIRYPELEPYSGDILYVSNINKVQRADGQSEEFKIILTV